MPFDTPDGQDSNHIHSGDTRIWGALSDLVMVKQMDIYTVPDSIMTFTPDGLKEKDKTETPGVDPDEEPESPGEEESEPADPMAGARRIRRPTRATLNLDKIWMCQSYRQPTRPVPFSKADEHNARTGKADDSGMNPVNMGALGKLTDIFRVSIASNFPPDSPLYPGVPEGAPDFEDESHSYNDQFGSGPFDEDKKFDRSRIVFGRLEIRISAHFYQRDRRSGPLEFDSRTLWPRDEAEVVDEGGAGTGEFSSLYPEGTARSEDLDYRFVESAFELKFTDEFDPAISDLATEDDLEKVKDEVFPDLDAVGMAGQVLVGKLLFNPGFHSWGVAVSIPRKENCYILDPGLATGTFYETDGVFTKPSVFETVEGFADGEKVKIDDRISIFLGVAPGSDPFTADVLFPKCPGPLKDEVVWDCEVTSAVRHISCEEIGSQTIQERFITLADRHNSLLNEIDRIFCILKYVSFNLEKISDASAAETYEEFVMGLGFSLEICKK